MGEIVKVVSIRQPWASFIAHGIKDIENRTWRTNYRGPIHIHACGPTKFNIELTDPQMKAVLLRAAMNNGSQSQNIIHRISVSRPEILKEH